MRSLMMQYVPADGWSSPPGDLDSANTVVFVFGGRHYADRSSVFEELRAAYPQAVVVGCSTSGEIAGRRLLDDSLSVAVCQFESTRLKVAAAEVGPNVDSVETGRRLATALDADDLRSVFVLSNGLHVNGTQLVAGMNEGLRREVIVTGGLAGDGAEFERTWVLEGADVSLNRTVAVGFYGDDLVFTHGSQGGWDQFGPERIVTRAEGNVLYELDNRPALDLYKQYLGEHAKDLPAAGLLFPLEIFEGGTTDRRLVRTILAVDDDANSLTFAGDIPVGASARLMRANFNRLVDGAEGSARAAASAEHGPNPVCLAISCVGRRLVLGERAEDELEAVADTLPDGTRTVGFYSYGELSPHVAGEPCDLHNQTMTLTVISERASHG